MRGLSASAVTVMEATALAPKGVLLHCIGLELEFAYLASYHQGVHGLDQLWVLTLEVVLIERLVSPCLVPRGAILGGNQVPDRFLRRKGFLSVFDRSGFLLTRSSPLNQPLDCQVHSSL